MPKTVNLEIELGVHMVQSYCCWISTMSDYQKFLIFYDSNIETLNYCQKRFRKCFTDTRTIPELVEKMVKAFKIKEWQLNVNGYFDFSQKKPWSVNGIIDIVKAIENAGYSIQFNLN